MTYHSTDRYLESEILSAGAVRRVQLMYQGTLKAIGKARAAVAAHDIPARTFQVNRALDILSELALSLDHQQGAPVSHQLVELYDYAQRCLIDGSARQIDKPFADAEKILQTLLDAWKSVPELDLHSSSGDSHGSCMPTDYSSGDSVSVGKIGSSLDQLG